MLSATIRQSLIDLGSVHVTRTRQRTAAEFAADAARQREELAHRRAIRDHRRQQQNGTAAFGVTEGTTHLHWDPIPLEAYGLSPEDVAAAISTYMRRARGCNACRFNVRFFAVTPDPEGGYYARGQAFREGF